MLREIDNATKAFPNAYIRMAAFDANRQVQVASMLVHRPSSAKEWRPVNQRQVGACRSDAGCLTGSAAGCSVLLWLHMCYCDMQAGGARECLAQLTAGWQ